MQNKKSLLQRLLVIYITFFIVLAASITHGILPSFTRGFADGSEIGQTMAEKWTKGTPSKIFLLSSINITGQPKDSCSLITAPDMVIDAQVRSLNLVVEQKADSESLMELAFSSLGGSPWIYTGAMVCPLFFLAIIILMALIIRSLRLSIKEERTLDKNNVWYMRIIGLLTIVIELIGDTTDYMMNSRAAQLLAQSGYTVDTGFHVSYSVIIMGILILFAAEVFAIGQNLSEEQKLTI